MIAIGGYKGTDPAPILEEFVHLARSHQVHWFIPGGTVGETGRQIETWVFQNVEPTVVEGVRIYDVSRTA